MTSILSAIGWLLRCEERNEGTFDVENADEEQIRRERSNAENRQAKLNPLLSIKPLKANTDPLGDTYANDRDSRGVQLAEPGHHQMVLGFFHSIRILLQAIFSPSSVPLIPALPQVRKRYVKHSAMEKLTKSDKAQHNDEECYICLRPIGTKHLALKEAAASAPATAATAFVFSPSSKLDVGELKDDENECSSSGSGSDDDEGSDDCGEKECFFSAKQQEQEHSERRRQPQTRPQLLEEEEGGEQLRERRRRRTRKNAFSSPPRLVLGLPCGHRFCDCCVRRWLSSHASCPTCRYQFPERECEVVKEP